MKVRLGFVSNSSSSSFLIGVPVKSGDTAQPDIREIFGIVQGSPIDRIIGEDLVKMAAKDEYTIEKILDDNGYESMAEFFEDSCYSDRDEMKRELFTKLQAGQVRVFRLRGSNEDDEAVGQMLYNMDIENQITEDGVYLLSEY